MPDIWWEGIRGVSKVRVWGEAARSRTSVYLDVGDASGGPETWEETEASPWMAEVVCGAYG